VKLSNNGYQLLKDAEGLRLKAYKDSAGIWTIGWGHTSPGITGRTTWNQQQAEDALFNDVKDAERCINVSVRCHLNQNQFDALVVFAYNIGVGAFADSSMRNLLNRRSYEGASQQFGRWNKVFNTNTGRHDVSNGLTTRRAAERALFDKPME
jgi:lysozyme